MLELYHVHVISRSLGANSDLITDPIYPGNAVAIFMFSVVFVAASWLRRGYKKPRAKPLFPLCKLVQSQPANSARV